MRTLLACVVAAALAFVIYEIWPEGREPLTSTSHADQPSASEALPEPQSNAASTESQPAQQKPAVSLEEAERFIDAVDVSGEDRAAFVAAGQTEWHERIRRVVVSSRYGKAIPRNIAEPMKGAYLHLFREHPDETLAAIADFRRALPLKKNPLEHLLMLDLARRLPTATERSADMANDILDGLAAPVRPSLLAAKTEAERNVALSVTAETNAVAFSHQVLVEQAKPEQAFSETLAALEQHADPGLRRQLALQFAQRYPDKRYELLAAAEKRGVDVELRKEPRSKKQ